MTDLPASKTEIAALIPHQGAMCLHDAVLAFDGQRILLACRTHGSPAHPFRHAAGLSGVYLAEFGAQAMAVHGGLLARTEGRRAEPGLLVSLRDFRVSVARIDTVPDPLETEAVQLAASAASWQYGFRVTAAGVLLAEGRATVMLHA